MTQRRKKRYDHFTAQTLISSDVLQGINWNYWQGLVFCCQGFKLRIGLKGTKDEGDYFKLKPIFHSGELTGFASFGVGYYIQRSPGYPSSWLWGGSQCAFFVTPVYLQDSYSAIRFWGLSLAGNGKGISRKPKASEGKLLPLVKGRPRVRMKWQVGAVVTNVSKGSEVESWMEVRKQQVPHGQGHTIDCCVYCVTVPQSCRSLTRSVP